MVANIVLVFLLLLIIFLLTHKKIQSWIDYNREQREIEFKKRTGLDLWSLYRLSAPAPFFWGLEKYLVPKPLLYFDEKNLYSIALNSPVVQYPLASILEVQRTAIMINKRRVWKIIINDNGKQMAYKFRTYENLDLFLERVKENPNAIVDDRYIWGIFQ